jgi:hypothetical protein
VVIFVGVARNGLLALLIGSLGGLFILFALREPILLRIGLGVGMFLFSFFITGYFHLVFLSKDSFFHIYNWMLLPVVNVVKWQNVTGVRLVSYDRECREDLSETMMEVQGNCSPKRQTILWPEAKASTLDEGLINYIVLELPRGKRVIPLEAFRRPNRVLRDVLMFVTQRA